jgi:hypothetical protein
MSIEVSLMQYTLSYFIRQSIHFSREGPYPFVSSQGFLLALFILSNVEGLVGMTLKEIVIPRETIFVDRGIPEATPDIVLSKADHPFIFPEMALILLFLHRDSSLPIVARNDIKK